MANMWKSSTDYHYALEPKGVKAFESRYHVIMQRLSDDPEIRASQQQYGLFTKKVNEYASTMPKSFLYDAYGRVIKAGDYAIILSKMDRYPLRVVACDKHRVYLEDISRGGRIRIASKNVMIITDQLMANEKRKALTAGQDARIVTGTGQIPQLRIEL